MRAVLVQPQARDDLREIWNYIAADNVAAADRASYRFWTVHPYVIVYQYDAKTVTVLRVVHGRRNFRRLFKR